MNIIGTRRIWYLVSAILVLIGILALGFEGLNLGIDFTGGSIIERGFQQEVKVSEIRDILNSSELASLDIGKAQIQPVGDNHDVIIRTRPLTNAEIDKIDDVLKAKYGEVEIRRTEVVGPVIGQELLHKAFWALVVASILILGYITVRFEFWFGVAAVIALIHDVLITLGLFAVLGREVNSPFIAAMLTVIGYSINDTIVVFDRIRENLTFRKKESFEELVNNSIVQTLPRSINTSLTTLLVVAALFFLGGTTIKDFTLALLIGIVSGTYSSIFVASALWVSWKEWLQKRASLAKARA